tara:strand:- start:1083 stop:2702 length:1620 start_codon:yes stop_codon:yes gene_type:complete
VAVIQISRIQIRRGQKNQGSGIPQLAGGELGWAMDSQEMFIGNGSVAEGAPLVGNTKVLTEHDNLFELADQYTYKSGSTIQTGETINTPIKRSLQQRLDDIVSTKAFGALGDDTDQTTKLQRAIDQLFLNPSTKGTEQARVVLVIEPGLYQLSDSLKVPPFATLRGAGKGKTKFIQTSNNPIFETVNESSTPGNYANDSSSTTLNQAQDIEISGITLDSTGSGPMLKLQSCKDSHFKDLEFKNYWETGDAITITNRAIEMNSLSSLVTCSHNIFDNIKINGIDVAVASDFDIHNNSFKNINVSDCGQGFLFGNGTVIGTAGQDTGPYNNQITHCNFSEIDNEAIWIKEGYGNESQGNYFSGVGNVGGNEGNAQYSVIKFEKGNNNSIKDNFERTKLLGYDQTYIVNAPYVSEIAGPVSADIGGFQQLTINERNTAITLFRLPGDLTRGYKVSYNYDSSAVNASRKGVLHIMCDKAQDAVHLVDDFDYFGDANFAPNMVISCELADANADTTTDTILIKVKNATPSDQGTFTYTINVQSA